MIPGTCRDSAGELEPLALPRASQVDAGEEHGQLRRLDLDPVPSSDLGHLEGAGLEPLEPDVMMPPFRRDDHPVAQPLSTVARPSHQSCGDGVS